MFPKQLQFHVERAHYGRAVRLYGAWEFGVLGDDGAARHVLAPVLAKKLNDDDAFGVTEPFMEMHTASAQQLFDALWTAGFRPVEATQSATGELDATRSHLHDMRAMVATLAKVELPATKQASRL